MSIKYANDKRSTHNQVLLHLSAQSVEDIGMREVGASVRGRVHRTAAMAPEAMAGPMCEGMVKIHWVHPPEAFVRTVYQVMRFNY